MLQYFWDLTENTWAQGIKSSIHIETSCTPPTSVIQAFTFSGFIRKHTYKHVNKYIYVWIHVYIYKIGKEKYRYIEFDLGISKYSLSTTLPHTYTQIDRIRNIFPLETPVPYSHQVSTNPEYISKCLWGISRCIRMGKMTTWVMRQKRKKKESINK